LREAVFEAASALSHELLGGGARGVVISFVSCGV
jgi:hypothetical protein